MQCILCDRRRRTHSSFMERSRAIVICGCTDGVVALKANFDVAASRNMLKRTMCRNRIFHC